MLHERFKLCTVHKGEDDLRQERCSSGRREQPQATDKKKSQLERSRYRSRGRWNGLGRC